MSAITMNVSEFATKVEEVIANLKRDEELILTGDQNQVVAKIVPASEPVSGTPLVAPSSSSTIITGDQNQIVTSTVSASEAVNAAAKPKRRQLGLSNTIAWISPDFDEPLEDFKEYMP